MQPFTFFISYRRQDTAPIALLLKYEIEKRLQFVRVFVDVENLRHGEAFPDKIREMIDKSHVTIALVGKAWMPRKATSGLFGASPKTDDAGDDWVVEELRHALLAPINYQGEDRYALERRRILPIFVDNPECFAPFELPKDIRDITKLHAERIDYAVWPSAIGPMIERIAIELNLKKRPDADEYPSPDAGKARTQPVPEI